MPRRQRWPTGPTRRSRRPRLVAVAALVVLVIAVGVFDYVKILHPHSDAAVRADAVVAIAGVNDPARLSRARQLAAEGYAPLVVTDIPSASYDGGCRPPGTVCFRPEPNSTRGEARAIAAMAKARGWHTVLLVVSADQAYRARIRFTRCFAGELRILTVPTGQSGIGASIYQDAALVKAEVWQRSC